MLTKFKNITGGLAAITIMAVFSYIYFVLISLKSGDVSIEEFTFVKNNFNGIYWVASCFGFAVFSGILFHDNKKKLVSVLYLLAFGFFTSCFLLSIFDFLVEGKLRMNKVYWAIIATFILTIITYCVKYVKHLLCSYRLYYRGRSNT